MHPRISSEDSEAMLGERWDHDEVAGADVDVLAVDVEAHRSREHLEDLVTTVTVEPDGLALRHGAAARDPDPRRAVVGADLDPLATRLIRTNQGHGTSPEADRARSASAATSARLAATCRGDMPYPLSMFSCRHAATSPLRPTDSITWRCDWMCTRIPMPSHRALHAGLDAHQHRQGCLSDLQRDQLDGVVELVAGHDAVHHAESVGLVRVECLREIEVLVGLMEVHHHPRLDHRLAAREPEALGSGIWK